MMDREDVSQLMEEIVPPEVEAQGLELVGLKVSRRNRTFLIEVFADRERGGITIDECAAINRRIINKIESEQLLEGDYTLAVSSPGIDWPLKTEKDFLRALNRQVRFHLEEPMDGKIEYAGTIRAIEGASVIVALTQGEITIPIRNIHKAVQII